MWQFNDWKYNLKILFFKKCSIIYMHHPSHMHAFIYHLCLFCQYTTYNQNFSPGVSRKVSLTVSLSLSAPSTHTRTFAYVRRKYVYKVQLNFPFVQSACRMNGVCGGVGCIRRCWNRAHGWQWCLRMHMMYMHMCSG